MVLKFALRTWITALSAISTPVKPVEKDKQLLSTYTSPIHPDPSRRTIVNPSKVAPFGNGMGGPYPVAGKGRRDSGSASADTPVGTSCRLGVVPCRALCCMDRPN